MQLHTISTCNGSHTAVSRSGTSKRSLAVRAASGMHQVIIDRRNAINMLGLGFILGGLARPSPSNAASGGDAQLVGSYLPADGESGLYRFVPAKDKTPALRAGVIKPEDSYSYALPGSFKEARISNTLNGNFCMPRCGEPWLEEVYEDPKVGKVQLLTLPLLKLTNAKSATIDKLGDPASLLPRIGPYVTGSYFDDDQVVSASKKAVDGHMYYFYELYGPDVTNGPHNLSCVTTKGEVVFAFMVSANDKQWKASEEVLRKTVASFRA